MLELRDVLRFVTLAEERHFGRAAACLGMGQPQLSRALQRLERQLGVRSNSSVRVTARHVTASTVDLAAAPLSVQPTKRRIP